MLWDLFSKAILLKSFILQMSNIHLNLAQNCSKCGILPNTLIEATEHWEIIAVYLSPSSFQVKKTILKKVQW